MDTNSLYTFNFTIKNAGRELWNKHGDKPVFVSYHWKNENRTVIWDGLRSQLPIDMAPGVEKKIAVLIKSPSDVGNYTLVIDFVKEGVTWFGSLKNVYLKEINVTVKASNRYDSEDGPIQYETDYSEINGLRTLMVYTLDLSATSFDGISGRVYGFFAGSGYPQIWVRDSSTIIPLARYAYRDEYIRSWIEEFLNHQARNGSIFDFVSPMGADKNTVETDQEISLVHSAYQYYKITGNKSWLLTDINGKSLINRLNHSLSYLLENRYNETYGLIIGAYTADWGDVQFEDPLGTHISNRTHWTCDIYDNAMFYLACNELSKMHSDLDDNATAGYWKRIASSIKENVNRYLWQHDKGFYKMHIILSPINLSIDERDMFPMGGNAMAIISGLANSTQAARIFEIADERKDKIGATTIGTVLVPSYPEGFFTNPIMDKEYEYQNGGQWDWFAGRLILAEFENGFSEMATRHLIDVSKQDSSLEGLYEWCTLNGIGMGSKNYAGSAGVLGRCIVEGYFGVNISREYVELKPRLGYHNGSISLYEPITSLKLSYDYTRFPNNTIILNYHCNNERSYKISILIPKGRIISSFYVNNVPVTYQIDQIGHDVYASIGTYQKSQECKIKLLSP
jgi:hypothetical protein